MLKHKCSLQFLSFLERHRCAFTRQYVKLRCDSHLSFSNCCRFFACPVTKYFIVGFIFHTEPSVTSSVNVCFVELNVLCCAVLCAAIDRTSFEK